MIKILTNDQIRVYAKQFGKPAGVIDKDYALEWLLFGIYHNESPLKNVLVFKGGTAIRKIFFPETWRFSEDLDFTIISETEPTVIVNGFKDVYDIIENESGIKYEGDINVPQSGLAIFGHVHFTGPIGQKNKIKIDASRVEQMMDSVTEQTVTTSYSDLQNFSIVGYSLDEVIAEKIRSLMQRSKVRDYYDIWRMFGQENNFDQEKIGKMVVEKCTKNNIDYVPDTIFDSQRLTGLEEHWENELGRLVIDDLPEPRAVFTEIESILTFLPTIR